MNNNGDKLRIHEDVASLKTDMKNVKAQVTNHIPTSIKEMGKLQRNEHESLRGMIGTLAESVSDLSGTVDGIKGKLAFYAGAIAVLLVVLEITIQVVLKFI